MFRGKRIISGIMLVLMLVSFIGCKKTSKAATFTYEENAAGNIEHSLPQRKNTGNYTG